MFRCESEAELKYAGHTVLANGFKAEVTEVKESKSAPASIRKKTRQWLIFTMIGE